MSAFQAVGELIGRMKGGITGFMEARLGDDFEVVKLGGTVVREADEPLDAFIARAHKAKASIREEVGELFADCKAELVSALIPGETVPSVDLDIPDVTTPDTYTFGLKVPGENFITAQIRANRMDLTRN